MWWLGVMLLAAVLASSAHALPPPVEVVEEERVSVDGVPWTRAVLRARVDGHRVQGEVWTHRPPQVERGAALGFAGWNKEPQAFIGPLGLDALASRYRVPVAVVAMGPSVYEPELYEETRPERRWCGEDCPVGGGRFVAEAVVPWLVSRDGPLSLMFGASTGARGAVAMVQDHPGLAGGIPPLCGMSGAWDLSALDPGTGEYRVHAQVFGEREAFADRWADRDPIQHVDRLRGQRVLLIHGQDDSVVPWRRAAAFAEALGVAGARVDLWTVPGGGHDPRVWRVGARACFSAAMNARGRDLVRRELAFDVERAIEEADIEPGTLAGDIALALADDVLDGAEVGVHVVDLRTGTAVYGRNEDRPLNPASVQKVLTSLVVLSHLHPSKTLETTVWRSGEVEDGRLKGDLIVQGGGDPGLVLERLWKLALEVRNQGIERVQGDVLVDPGLLGPVEPIPGWPKGIESPDAPPYAAPVSGLSANYNAFALHIDPGPEEGAPLVARLEWPVDHVDVVVEGRTLAERARGSVTVARELVGGRERLRVSGGLPVGSDRKREYLNIADPALYTGAAFVELFQSLGGKVDGAVRHGEVPKDAEEVLRYASLPVGTLLSLQNKWSSNPIAEHLLRATSARVLGDGSSEGAVRLMEQTLRARGVDLEGAVLVNGSGLSREGRLSARQIVEAMAGGLGDPTLGPDLLASLAIWGVDGTALRLGRQDPLAGQVRLKTGSVNGVKAVAGVVGCPTHPGFGFALLVNEVKQSWAVPRVWGPFFAALQARCGSEPPP